MGLLRKKVDKDLLNKYLFELLNLEEYKNIVRNKATGSNIQNLSNAIQDIKIPLPPLAIQQKIVNECEAIDAQVAQAQEQTKTAKREIAQEVQAVVNGGYKMKRLGEVGKVSMCKRVFKNQTSP